MALNIIWEKPKVRPDYIDNYILGLWDRIASGADLSKLVVTCLYRDAAEQARAMFNNLVSNKPAHSRIQQQKLIRSIMTIRIN
jgi:hypothetical protein